MMTCRTAGRLRDGGGPGISALVFSHSIGLGEAQVLEVGAGHARPQRVAVQPGPGAALEVVETEFLLICW